MLTKPKQPVAVAEESIDAINNQTGQKVGAGSGACGECSSWYLSHGDHGLNRECRECCPRSRMRVEAQTPADYWSMGSIPGISVSQGSAHGSGGGDGRLASSPSQAGWDSQLGGRASQL